MRSKTVLSSRVRWSWWRPVGWVIQTRYADGSSSKEWARPALAHSRVAVDERPSNERAAPESREAGPTCWAGSGAELWRVRVDLFVPDDSPKWVSIASEGLRPLLTGGDDKTPRGAYGIDQGTGIASRPVVGLLFWIRADDVGRAALEAVETARRALAEHVENASLYDVTVIPEAAVAREDDLVYPPMPD